MKGEEKNVIVSLGQSLIGCGGAIAAAVVTGLCSLVIAFNTHASIDLSQLFPSAPVVIATVVPTPVVRATVPPATSLVPSNWPLVLSDHFNSNANGWIQSQTQPYTDEYGQFDESMQGGKLNLVANATSAVVSRYAPIVRPVSDLYLTAEAKQMSGPTTAHYGLFFRYDSSGNYYFFKLEDQKDFAVSMWYQKQWTNLIGFTPSDAIRPGAINQLTVIAQGSHFTFLINNQQVGELNDTRMSSGQNGVAFELGSGQQAAFAFTNFELRAP